MDCDKIQLWLAYYFPHLPADIILSVQQWQGRIIKKKSISPDKEEKLEYRIQELEDTQKTLLSTIQMYKAQNQELLAKNEILTLQNLELKKQIQQ